MSELEGLNIDLIDIADYLISLFYKTNKKYTTSRTKIGKLLSIVAFSGAKYGIKFFNEIIYKYGNSGTIIEELLHYEQQIYLVLDDIDCSNKILRNEINNNLKSRFDNNNLDVSIKELVIDVFLNFGAYSTLNLGKMINEFREEIYNDDKTFIDLEKIKDLDCKRNNDILIYISSQRVEELIENIKNKYILKEENMGKMELKKKIC